MSHISFIHLQNVSWLSCSFLGFMLGFTFVSHDTIEHGVMWHDVDKNSIAFTCDSCRDVLNHEFSRKSS